MTSLHHHVAARVDAWRAEGYASDHDRTNPVDPEDGRKALALMKWEGLNPNRLKYQMIFTSTDAVTHDQMQDVRKIAEEVET